MLISILWARWKKTCRMYLWICVMTMLSKHIYCCNDFPWASNAKYLFFSLSPNPCWDQAINSHELTSEGFSKGNIFKSGTISRNWQDNELNVKQTLSLDGITNFNQSSLMISYFYHFVIICSTIFLILILKTQNIKCYSFWIIWTCTLK